MHLRQLISIRLWNYSTAGYQCVLHRNHPKNTVEELTLRSSSVGVYRACVCATGQSILLDLYA